MPTSNPLEPTECTDEQHDFGLHYHGNDKLAYRPWNRSVNEQPMPEPNSGKPVWELVIEDMKNRDQVGRNRYGTPLQVFNGRKALVDAYQEILDAAVYIRQEIEERKLLEESSPTTFATLGGFAVTSEGITVTSPGHSHSGFFDRYSQAVNEMLQLVRSRDREGRNATSSPREQFASTEAVLDMIYMKYKRAKSYLAADNFDKFVEECFDVGNYALFAVVFERELRDE